jgi:hypothetical protein
MEVKIEGKKPVSPCLPVHWPLFTPSARPTFPHKNGIKMHRQKG